MFSCCCKKETKKRDKRNREAPDESVLEENK